MKELYTHKPYSGKYISEWIDKRKDTRFTKEIKKENIILIMDFIINVLLNLKDIII